MSNLHKSVFNATAYKDSPSPEKHAYFTDFTLGKGIFYAIVLLYVMIYSIIVLVEPFVPDELICDETLASQGMIDATEVVYLNPSYVFQPCRHMRLPALVWMKREECNFGRRLLAAVLLGGIVGWERREADRPAGIRTMSLVSLGACLFTINSAFAFRDGPMGWDASRIAAAVPSGVGFLGAGLIFKEAQKDKESDETTHVVHGLTTAASLWISAAVGVACAGQLYFSATFTVGLVLALLRFGPRQHILDQEEDEEDDAQMSTGFLARYDATGSTREQAKMLTERANASDKDFDPELQPLKHFDSKAAMSVRSRKRMASASLGGIL